MAYTESLPNSFRFNSVESVDTIFSKLLIANLFKDQTFKSGVTFSDKYNERGGQIYVRRLGKIQAKLSDATATDGLKFTHTNTQDSLVLIQKKDRISVSEECYDLVENLRASGKSVDKVSEAIDAFKERCQILYMSYLLADPVEDGAVGVGGALRSANTTSCKTLKSLTDSILADREQIRVNGGVADTLIIAPEMETLFLASPTAQNAFIPESNEEWLKSGRIGRLYGMNVYTSNLIGAGAPSAVPVAGNATKNVGNSSKCEYIIYDHNDFAICGDIESLRMVNAIDFVGSYAQLDGVFGGGIINPALAIAKMVETVS